MTEVDALIEVAKALQNIANALNGIGWWFFVLGIAFLLFKNMGCNKD